MEHPSPKRPKAPKSKAGKLLVNLAVTAVVGFLYFYIVLPPLNFQSGDFYSFIGVLCEADNAAQLRHRSWVDVTAELDVKRHEIYGGEGPWLRASQVTPTTPPQDELVYFLR